MAEVDNKIWQEDIEKLIQDNIFNSYKNSSILITGATGLIGSWLVLSFLAANRIKKLNNKIYALIRNTDKAKNIFKNVFDDPNMEFVIQDIQDEINISENIDYIFHCANITSSKTMMEKPIDVILSTTLGTNNVLDFAVSKKASVLYLSSLEIYGKHEIQKDSIKEDDYGVLDSKNIRNCYPISKKNAETLCLAYHITHNLDVKIARLTQTFGPGVSKEENRVFVQFAKNIIQNKDIVLKTDGLSYKNYCYITDTISALLMILQKGRKAAVYNVANSETALTIKDLALRLIENFKSSCLKFEINEDNPYLENVHLKLDTALLESLDWKPKVGIDEMFDRLIEYLKLEGE
ncbi:NAD-dependent epimerase/dehydratase family protein [bacterium]|nr:NAD-dependent epimerase/dehydratase family protein [bacterium]